MTFLSLRVLLRARGVAGVILFRCCGAVVALWRGYCGPLAALMGRRKKARARRADWAEIDYPVTGEYLSRNPSDLAPVAVMLPAFNGPPVLV